MGCMVDQQRYSAPMPWIGLYITAASLACSIAMFVDYAHGLRRRKVWFPCKLFSLNATSLTLLAIATKLPVDLSTPMPSAQEQFAKLSGTSLICVAMGHFMPSIGDMEDTQVILNLVPLVILVITVIVNICVQMSTGVIHAFIPEHIITLCFTLMMLLITCSSALAIPTMKGLLKQQLELNCREMQHKRQPNEPAMSTVESLKKDMKKYLLMALTSNPQHVHSRSPLGSAAGFVCNFQGVVLIEAFVRMLKRAAVPVCTNQSSSDYKWSIPFIVFSQAFTVVVGIVNPVFRTMFLESRGHQGQQSADREEKEPSDCWALPLVTLTSIALAIPCAQGDQIKQLLRDGLSEGLKYVRHVDKSLDSQGRLAKVREAADIAWQGAHLYNQWLDVDLAAFATERGGPKNVIERLANKGSSYEAEVESLVKGRGDMKSGLRWPPRALALYSMANICKSILITDSNFIIDDADALFKQLHVVISDMLGACLAELPRALYIQCHNSSVEGKEDRVMDAAYLLGEAENILKALPTGGLVVNEGKYVEHWRSFMPNWSDLSCISPVNASNTAV
ncbi:hypothetical protein ACLOJK_038957 [Asimina triloba]